MKKILFYSLVDWDWIKQRPQFIALGLAEQGYTVRAIYLYQYRRKELQKTDSKNIQLRPIYRIPPLGNRFSLVNEANRWLVRKKIAREIQNFKPDIIWITHPSQFTDIPETFSGKIIYDCMDDYDVLGTHSSERQQISNQEQALCERSDTIFVSSIKLMDKICRRNPNKMKQVHLIRNGCNGSLYPRVIGTHKNKIYAGYVGTIAEWFDFDLLLGSLECIPNLEYFLIGPVRVKDAPYHERIHYLGTIAHQNLFDTVKEMDCLVMPFRLNDIVLAVDPVKLYEYISWQKRIVAIDYPEIHRFKDFVSLYSGVDEYCSLLTQQDEKQTVFYSEKDAALFLTENSWSKRVDSIVKIMQE